MRTVFFLLIFSQAIFAQKFMTRNGFTEMKASVEAFEPVEAKNNSTTAILTNDGQIASQLFITAFKFKVALMQEHFNENYMDSDKYPKATFKGKVEGFNAAEIDENKEYIVKGTLTVREIGKEISFPAKISKKDSIINFTGGFIVLPSDFNIDIPSIVSKKIADKINITMNYDFTEKK